MNPWLLMALTTAVGARKGEEDKGREKKQRLLNSEITRYSPWTDIGQEAVQAADPTGSMMQGAISGAMMGQGMASTDKQNALLDAQANYYKQQALMQAPGTGPHALLPGQGPLMAKGY